jgi:hypothetical protein
MSKDLTGNCPISLLRHIKTVLTLRIMVVGGGQNDNNTNKNTIKLHLQNIGREEY